MLRAVRCAVQPCRHVLGTLRSRSQPRVAVIARERRENAWILHLECGHPAVRRIEHFVYAPYPELPPPKVCYCALCPPMRKTGARLRVEA